jgi:ketosteroid isomerase-like protein
MVRALFGRWNAGQHGAEAFPDYFDPAIELESPFSSIRGEPYRGYAGMEEWVRDQDEQFAVWSISPDEVRQIGSQVIVTATVEARGRTSDITLHVRSATVVDFASDHRLKRVRIYTDVDEARKAVGLSGEAGSTNLDLVRSIYADWERGDYNDVTWAHPELEYVMAGGPDPGVWRGVRGMAEAFRGMLKAWTDWRVTADDYVEVDRERILVPYHFTARGRASGLEAGRLHTQGATLFELQAGRVRRIVQYFDRERAVADLGLVDEGGSADS